MRPAARALGPVLAVVLVLGLVCVAHAQREVSFHGRVIWISAFTMAFAPDEGGSFDVDLSDIDQTVYEFIKSGDAVTVIGVVSRDGNRVIAESIIPDEPPD